MKSINLRDYYPAQYKSDCFIEVPDEVENLFIVSKQNEAAYERRKYYYNAQYSLDRDDGIGRYILHNEPSAEETFEREATNMRILEIMKALPDKQARRVYACYFLGVSKESLAKEEGVSRQAISASVRDGLRNIRKILEKFSK